MWGKFCSKLESYFIITTEVFQFKRTRNPYFVNFLFSGTMLLVNVCMFVENTNNVFYEKSQFNFPTLVTVSHSIAG